MLANIETLGARGTTIRSSHRLWLAKAIVGAAMLLTGSLASATLIVTPGVDNTGTDNVLANACDPHITGPALTVQGCLNTDHAFFVNFTSDENIEYSGGQAKIVAEDDAFSFLSVSLDKLGWTFNKLLLNIDSIEDGFVTFTGLPGGVSQPWALSKNGQNKFIITGEDFLAVSFQTTVGISSVDLVSDVKQVRIGGVKPPEPDDPDDPDDPDPVPIPGTALLLSLGLLALRLVRRKA